MLPDFLLRQELPSAVLLTYSTSFPPSPNPLFPTTNTRHEHGRCSKNKRPLCTTHAALTAQHTLLSALALVPVQDMPPELLLRYRLPLARHCAETQFTASHATQHEVGAGQHTPPLSL